MRRLVALALDQGAHQRVVAVNPDELERGARARREIGFATAGAEQGPRARQAHDRNDQSVMRAELAPLVDDRPLGFLEVTPPADIAPRVGPRISAQLFDDRIVNDVVLFRVAVDVFGRTVVEPDAVLELSARARDR